MHISDGILSLEVAVTTAVVTAGLVLWSLKGLKNSDIALVASMGALFFIASFIHIPLGPTQIHLLLLGVVGILLGKRVFLAIFVALLFQATLLGYGGLSSLGANLLIMALPAYLTFILIRSGFLSKFHEKVQYIFIGAIPVLFSTLLLALLLVLSKEEYLYASYTIILANIPAVIVEGLVTLFLVNYLKKSIPWVLKEVKL